MSASISSASSARWTASQWRSASFADSSDEEDRLDLRQPFPLGDAYRDAPAFEGRGARPKLHSGSKSSAFQHAFDEQQTFWRRKWKKDPEFQKNIIDCAQIQTWLLGAIDNNELNVEAIRWVAASCGTSFLKAIGYIAIPEGRSGHSIVWTQEELLDAFADGGNRYSDSSRKTFLLTQAMSIGANGLSVLVEGARPALHGSTVNYIKLGIKTLQVGVQLCVTPMGFLLGAHAQPPGVKGYELAGIPYALNVSSIDYKVPVFTAAGEKLESVPYANAKDVRWSQDLIEMVNFYCDGNLSDDSSIQGILNRHAKALSKRLNKLNDKSRLSIQQKHKVKLITQRLALVNLGIQRVQSPSNATVKKQFAKEEGNLRKELALAEISATFNSAPSQSKVRAARYKAFALQATLNLISTSARLGHCVPRSVVTAASSMANNITWAGSQLADMGINANATETSQLVEQCTGFNPWGFAFEVANFGLSIANPMRYWWNLPEASADDYQRKFIAYSAALMLQPHGLLTDAEGDVNPEAFDLMLRGRMWRVLDCVVKSLESDLHCSASALMTHIVNIAVAPVDESDPYEWLIVQFEALKSPGERQHFMEVCFTQRSIAVPPEVNFLLAHYEQIVTAIGRAKEGSITRLLDDHLISPDSVLLLRSALTIAAGGAVTANDELAWNDLMRIFGDIEASSYKTEQETQKGGQGFAKKGVAGTTAFTLVKSIFDFSAAVAKAQSTYEHDTADIISKVVQILGGLVALGGSSAGYLASYCYWQFILEKNRQRQARLNNKFSPPNSSILNPYAKSYLRGFNRDRCRGVVTRFRTLLAFQIDDRLIDKQGMLTYDQSRSTFWEDIYAQINVVDLGLGVHNACERLTRIVHPDETLLNAEVDEISRIIESANKEIVDAKPDEVKKIIKAANRNIVQQLRTHIAARKDGVSPSTVTGLTNLLVEASDGAENATNGDASGISTNLTESSANHSGSATDSD
ncbi:hypothetical protein ASE08_13795 [Rhizobacter sp. Root16D2]|nr:hypothetical protein ASC88_04810 [Rhizobacter sp. Root29]KQV98719.1 hypothetical protein ASC98_08640 [Rhizobacter sp. Root1238]KRB04973.1 hypothetical protein ASE08_13795 [Rhizobacter sp. Root16D2]